MELKDYKALQTKGAKAKVLGLLCQSGNTEKFGESSNSYDESDLN